MSGRAKSPVDQAWEYANNNVGTKWVLVSNYLEIRLYSYAEGRQSYEVFDLKRLHEPAEYARAQLLLSEENLLGGRTAELLEESRRENRDITDRLYDDYKVLRSDLIGEVRRERPEMDPLQAIRTGQTILDRVLFIAFAEDTGLLPPKTLGKAYEHNDPYHPQPIWQTFLALFRSIDEGNAALKIPRYNGGLFAPEPTISALAIPDHICKGFKRLSEYDFASEISVTVLGHIFEQSITDVEQLQAEALGQEIEPKRSSGTSGRRKRDGVVYTPDYIARFIVEQTLGTHAREIFAGLLVEHAAKGASPQDDPIKWKGKASERAAWEAYRERLARLRIVDPACGSGVFLVMAFDWLKIELARVDEKLVEITGIGALYNVDSEILTHNLFGVDVNEESVEIAKLSLWIKTARHGKVLDSLDRNFRVGDSLIEDSSYAYRNHGFVWKEAFADIFSEGGFDIVLGNPPFVHMGRFKELKPYLKKRYAVVADRADLSAYFFERGIKNLKAGGRLGYVSTSTFFKTGSGQPLRSYLGENLSIEAIVDFGDIQIFEGVATLPMILTGRRAPPGKNHELRFWAIDELPKENFEAAFEEHAHLYPQRALVGGVWELEDLSLRAIREKIKSGKPTLKEVYGSPLYGIKTGLNEAFVVDEKTKEKLCTEDPRSSDLLKPFLEGKDIKRWRSESRNMWLIYIAKNRIKIDDYPAIRDWLLPFKSKLERRATKQEWFELQQAQEAYFPSFKKPKIFYAHFNRRYFFRSEKQEFCNDKGYIIPTGDWFLLALFVSNPIWFILSNLAPQVIGGSREVRSQYVETLPIPTASDEQKAELAGLAEAAQTAAEKRYALQREITRRIPDLANSGGMLRLTERLKAWWELPDFAAFQSEVKRALKGNIPLKERNAWESWITENRAQIHALTAEITRLEREINRRAYALFDLTSEEIALLEASV
jgi:type I restriction-modification system DNA methylase subunit